MVFYLVYLMASTPVWRAFDSNLIDSVRSKPVLFNTRLKEFRNNKIKENVWKTVAAELEESGKRQDLVSVIGVIINPGHSNNKFSVSPVVF